MPKSILIHWKGLPICSALVTKLSADKDFLVDIAYSKASVPFSNIEQYHPDVRHFFRLKDDNSSIDVTSLLSYDLILTTGWSSNTWVRTLRWVKKINPQIIIVSMIDNIAGSTPKRLFRQFLGRFYYKMFLRHIFDYCFVPGSKSYKFMTSLGHSSNKIFQGYYGAYSKLFHNIDFSSKQKKFLYVGQVIPRKGVDLLLKAFALYRKNGGSWKLSIIGYSNTKAENQFLHTLETKEVDFKPFMQPVDISKEFSTTSCFILPSRRDHWGTVMCEAAQSGCLLIGSAESGSTHDLIRIGINGFLFESEAPDGAEQLASCMSTIDKISKDLDLHDRMKVSSQLALNYSENSFYLSVKSILAQSTLQINS